MAAVIVPARQPASHVVANKAVGQPVHIDWDCSNHGGSAGIARLTLLRVGATNGPSRWSSQFFDVPAGVGASLHLTWIVVNYFPTENTMVVLMEELIQEEVFRLGSHQWTLKIAGGNGNGGGGGGGSPPPQLETGHPVVS